MSCDCVVCLGSCMLCFLTADCPSGGFSASARMPPTRPLSPHIAFHLPWSPHMASPQASLGFLTAWWLGSKSTKVRLVAFPRIDIMTLLLHSISQVSFEASIDTKGGKWPLPRGDMRRKASVSLFNSPQCATVLSSNMLRQVKEKQITPSPALYVSSPDTPPGYRCVVFKGTAAFRKPE